jgi:hypothetical protein
MNYDPDFTPTYVHESAHVVGIGHDIDSEAEDAMTFCTMAEQ